MTKTATKRDDYTRLQNLNALFSVIGSSSTNEETLQLQRTLSFMRDNDEDAQMTVKSFEHCIEQVVRFHFPKDRNFPFTHWNARSVSIDPLWVRASVLEFIQSFQGNRRGLLLVSGLRESLLRGGKRWTVKKEREYQELRSFIEGLVLRYAKAEQNLTVLFF
ncbi:MAG: hypothetical protein CMI29_08760 [Opitutae bacterium]|nr:hypothetical protein [Opitutae bacterium]